MGVGALVYGELTQLKRFALLKYLSLNTISTRKCEYRRWRRCPRFISPYLTTSLAGEVFLALQLVFQIFVHVQMPVVNAHGSVVATVNRSLLGSGAIAYDRSKAKTAGRVGWLLSQGGG